MEYLTSQNNLTVVNMTDLTGKWLAYNMDLNHTSLQTYLRAINQFNGYLICNHIQAPTREDIIAFKDFLIITGHKATTVANYLMAIKLFYKWAVYEGLLPKNIAENIKAPRIDREFKKDYLTTAQIYDLLMDIDRSTLQGKRDYAIISLMLTTGLRCISVVNADTKDLQTRGNCKVLYYKGKGHTDKDDYVKLGYSTEKAINDYLAHAEPTDALFISLSDRNKGRRLTTRSVSRIVKEHLRDINLDSERLTAHSLRHTTATQNLLNGGTLEETQELLGHSNINTTLIYSQALKRDNNQSEYRLDKLFFAQGNA